MKSLPRTKSASRARRTFRLFCTSTEKSYVTFESYWSATFEQLKTKSNVIFLINISRMLVRKLLNFQHFLGNRDHSRNALEEIPELFLSGNSTLLYICYFHLLP